MQKVIIIFVIIFSTLTIAQRKPDDHKHFGKKFEELEKLKLLETLDLDEETAIKFFTRRKKSHKKVDELFKENHLIFKRMEEALENNKDTEYPSLVKKSTEIENKIMNEKLLFIKSLNDILTEEQILKVILFDHKFKKEIRNLLLERGRKKYFRK